MFETRSSALQKARRLLRHRTAGSYSVRRRSNHREHMWMVASAAERKAAPAEEVPGGPGGAGTRHQRRVRVQPHLVLVVRNGRQHLPHLLRTKCALPSESVRPLKERHCTMRLQEASPMSHWCALRLRAPRPQPASACTGGAAVPALAAQPHRSAGGAQHRQRGVGVGGQHGGIKRLRSTGRRPHEHRAGRAPRLDRLHRAAGPHVSQHCAMTIVLLTPHKATHLGTTAQKAAKQPPKLCTMLCLFFRQGLQSSLRQCRTGTPGTPARQVAAHSTQCGLRASLGTPGVMSSPLHMAAT